jgi:hypothetical protein
VKVFFSKREKEKREIKNKFNYFFFERQEVICRDFGQLDRRPKRKIGTELSQVRNGSIRTWKTFFWGGPKFVFFLEIFFDVFFCFLTRIDFVCFRLSWVAERLLYRELASTPGPRTRGCHRCPTSESPFLKRNMKDFLCEVWDKFFMSKNFLLFHDLDFFFFVL